VCSSDLVSSAEGYALNGGFFAGIVSAVAQGAIKVSTD
jgi:hypothetical protein